MCEQNTNITFFQATYNRETKVLILAIKKLSTLVSRQHRSVELLNSEHAHKIKTNETRQDNFTVYSMFKTQPG